MAATLRELRGRIKSASSIKKITKAQELIATSRIAKAQARVDAARPYATEITNMLTELAGASALDHPLLVERKNPRRAGVLVVSSDRGLCGGYNANVLRRAEELFSLLRDQGKTPVVYVVGRKALGYYSFRQRSIAEHQQPALRVKRQVIDARATKGREQLSILVHAHPVVGRIVQDKLAVWTAGDAIRTRRRVLRASRKHADCTRVEHELLASAKRGGSHQGTPQHRSAPEPGNVFRTTGRSPPLVCLQANAGGKPDP